MATIMVLDRAIRYGNDNGTSVYDSCGLQLVDYKKFCTIVHLHDFLVDLCYQNSAGGVKI